MASILSTSGLPSVRNLIAANPNTAPSTIAMAAITSSALNKWGFPLLDQSREPHKRQTHQSRGDHGDRRTFENRRDIRTLHTFTHTGEQHHHLSLIHIS